MFLISEVVLFGIPDEGGKRCRSKEGSYHRYPVNGKVLRLLPWKERSK